METRSSMEGCTTRVPSPPRGDRVRAESIADCAGRVRKELNSAPRAQRLDALDGEMRPRCEARRMVAQPIRAGPHTSAGAVELSLAKPGRPTHARSNWGPDTQRRASALPELTNKTEALDGAEHRVRTGDLRLGTGGVHEGSRPVTKQHEPLISLGSPPRTALRSSTDLHADSRRSCAQYVPGFATETAASPLDVAQLAALLRCSTAHVYDLCERGELPHSRDRYNAIRFDCRVLGRALNLTLGGRLGHKPRDT